MGGGEERGTELTLTENIKRKEGGRDGQRG